MRLQEQLEKLKHKVNPHVNEMAEKAEADYEELIKKRDRMTVDKDKIQAQIEKLDDLKNKTLQMTFDIDNASFGKIFGTLLPGAQGELVKICETDIQQGIKIRVGFNNEWKESLSELSGG